MRCKILFHLFKHELLKITFTLCFTVCMLRTLVYSLWCIPILHKCTLVHFVCCTFTYCTVHCTAAIGSIFKLNEMSTLKHHCSKRNCTLTILGYCVQCEYCSVHWVQCQDVTAKMDYSCPKSAMKCIKFFLAIWPIDEKCNYMCLLLLSTQVANIYSYLGWDEIV